MMAKKVPIADKPKREKEAESWVSSGGGKSVSSGKMKRLTIDVSEQLHKRIKIECATKGMNMADAIRELLEKNFQ